MPPVLIFGSNYEAIWYFNSFVTVQVSIKSKWARWRHSSSSSSCVKNCIAGLMNFVWMIYTTHFSPLVSSRLVSLIEKLNQFWAENGGKYKLIESKLTSSDDFLFIRILIFIQIFNFWTLGKWLCTVVASNTRGPQFESSHWQKFIMNIFTVNCWKD